MQIIKIDRTDGNYIDTEENRFDLLAVASGDAAATNKTVLTEYDDIADCLTQTGWTLIEE